MYRVEDKYMCSERELRLLEARIGSVLKCDSNQNSEGGYQITSVYFDDVIQSHYQDTEDGNRQRMKYRIRTYNHSLDTIKLEVKEKKYSRVLKRSKLITKDEMFTLLSGNCIADEEMSLESPVTLFNTAIKMDGLRPKVIVEYDRKAYVFDPGNVRITFDRNIRASREIGKFSDSDIVYDYLRDGDCVLEVKYDEFIPGFILEILELGNMIQVSCSKYRLCYEREEV